MHPTLRVCTVVTLSAVLAASLGSCGDDGSGPGAVSFASDVQPIFSASCALSNCHGTTNTQPTNKPMVLAAGQAYANIVNVSSHELGSMDRVEPNQPDQSYLVHKIQGTHLTVGGSGERMPLGGNPLSTSQINLIRDWITQGAPNN